MESALEWGFSDEACVQLLMLCSAMEGGRGRQSDAADTSHLTSWTCSRSQRLSTSSLANWLLFSAEVYGYATEINWHFLCVSQREFHPLYYLFNSSPILIRVSSTLCRVYSNSLLSPYRSTYLVRTGGFVMTAIF